MRFLPGSALAAVAIAAALGVRAWAGDGRSLEERVAALEAKVAEHEARLARIAATAPTPGPTPAPIQPPVRPVRTLPVHAEGTGMEPIDGTLSSLAIVSTDSRIDLAPGVFFTVGREKLSVDDVAEVRFTWDGVEPARAPSVEIVTTQGRSIRIPLQGGVITSISLGVVGSDRRPRSYQWIASRGERPSRPPREIIVISFPK